MSDDKRNTGAPDRNLVNMSEDYEVEYWTRELGVSKAELQAAVRAVGNSATKVREYLRAR